MTLLCRYPVLSAYKRKAFAKFQQEALQLIDKGLFYFPFIKLTLGFRFRNSNT